MALKELKKEAEAQATYDQMLALIAIRAQHRLIYTRSSFPEEVMREQVPRRPPSIPFHALPRPSMTFHDLP